MNCVREFGNVGAYGPTVDALPCKPPTLISLPYAVPIGSIIVPFCGLVLGSYKVIPKRNY